jgi:hypothetical protein
VPCLAAIFFVFVVQQKKNTFRITAKRYDGKLCLFHRLQGSSCHSHGMAAGENYKRFFFSGCRDAAGRETVLGRDTQAGRGKVWCVGVQRLSEIIQS